jgi:hypothetical protein
MILADRAVREQPALPQPDPPRISHATGGKGKAEASGGWILPPSVHSAPERLTPCPIDDLDLLCRIDFDTLTGGKSSIIFTSLLKTANMLSQGIEAPWFAMSN